MPEENPSLRESVEKAAEEQNKNGKEKAEELSEGKTEKAEGEGEGKSKETQENNNVGDPEIEDAVAFYRALRDPAQQTEIIQNLALRAGLLKPEQKLTEKEEKKYSEMLYEILGEEYPDLRDKLGKVFQQFERENDAKIGQIKAEMEAERRQKAASDFESEFSNFIKENKVTDEEAGRMLDEIKDLPPTIGQNGKRINLTVYLGKIHKLAVSEKRVEKEVVKRSEKIQQNLKERSTNLSSDISDDRLKKGSRLPSIREAIRAASEGISFDKD